LTTVCDQTHAIRYDWVFSGRYPTPARARPREVEPREYQPTVQYQRRSALPADRRLSHPAQPPHDW